MGCSKDSGAVIRSSTETIFILSGLRSNLDSRILGWATLALGYHDPLTIVLDHNYLRNNFPAVTNAL
ncbi:Endochitinase B1 [Fusarium oxysporum f. sp. albedinis]|nr:Endochitinase B1 [Fusarium oxysporum f. sp. albedinis]